MRLKLMIAAATMLSTSLAARADQVFTFSGVNFSTSPSGGTNAGTLSGKFTTNNALNSVLSYDITASAAGSFTGFEYTTADSSITASSLPSQFFQIDSTNGFDELRIYLSSALTSSGAQISASASYEHEPSGGNRFPSGSIVPAAAAPTSVTPEPSSLVLLGTGLLGALGVARKRFA